MVATTVIEHLRQLDTAGRLAVIEEATRLIREDLDAGLTLRQQDDALRRQASAVQDLYEPGGELTEWIALDAEEVLDDTRPR